MEPFLIVIFHCCKISPKSKIATILHISKTAIFHAAYLNNTLGMVM